MDQLPLSKENLASLEGESREKKDVARKSRKRSDASALHERYEKLEGAWCWGAL